MIIDIKNKEVLKLESSRDIFLQGLKFINSIDKYNTGNIYFELTRTTNIRDEDINFLFYFLIVHNYISINNKTLIVLNHFNPDKVITDFCHYYLYLIQSNIDLNKELFLTSEFSIEKDSIIIKVDSIPIVYRPFLIVLQKLKIMESSNKKGFVIVSNYFLAKKILERPLRKISQKDFDNEQEQKKLRGFKAELFVLNFEKEKLKEVNYSPRRVSQENIGLGYDIESYEINGANIFIEVKSLLNGEMFYWSKNEIEVSKRLNKHYVIYAVLFNKLEEPIKVKKMIFDPYKEIFVLKKITKQSSGDYLITI